MKTTGLMKPIVATALALALLGLGACTTYAESPREVDGQASTASKSDQAGEADESDELGSEGIGDLELSWAGYTVGFELISDDQDLVVSLDPADGQWIKICFKYLGGGSEGGFTDISDLVDENPITLHRDSDDTDYESNGSVGDLSVAGSGDISDLTIDEVQERFSILFDVPASSALGDFSLDLGSGELTRLEPYISDEYQAEIDDLIGGRESGSNPPALNPRREDGSRL
ncbi:MAG: hypothetical protein LBG11_11810 [Bifidobacteriaceae bacterium]|jgi:hypothetical protein|nr:hypothetical protein [Bifidobacteriaceae bacterium]